MASEIESFLTEWHRVVSEKDRSGILPLLADDVSLGAPPYWDRLQGRESVRQLLGLILETIEDFTYQREWQKGNELALEFTGRVGELELQGIDLISLGDQLTVQNIDVLIRPMNAVDQLRDIVAPKMASFFASRGASQ